MKYSDWESVVRAYTAARLTKKTDRLITFSAIAKEYAVSLGDEYVAGLWRNDLLHQLCWLERGADLYQPHCKNKIPLYQAPF